MGYYVTLSEADWAYAAENQATCLLALQVMSSEAWNAMKNGGTTMSDGTKKYWWRWQSEQFPADCSTLRQVFESLGFDCEEDDNGTLRLIGYNNKRGDEQTFLQMSAPYVIDGSWMEWFGESNDDFWRFEVHDGKFYSRTGYIEYAPIALG